MPGDKIILDAKSTTPTTTSNVDFSILLEDSLQPTGYGYDTAYIILDSSAIGFADEHGKIDLEAGVLTGELDGLLLEQEDILVANSIFSTQVTLDDTDGTITTVGGLTFDNTVQLSGQIGLIVQNVTFNDSLERELFY